MLMDKNVAVVGIKAKIISGISKIIRS